MAYPTPDDRHQQSGLLGQTLKLPVSTTVSALSLALLFSLLTPLTAPAARPAPLQKRDFLPPIATINPKIEAGKSDADDNELEAISLSAVSSPVIHASPRVDRLDSDISGQIRSEQLKGLLEIQKKIDEADLEYLWRATVEKNPVIRFSLEKLATPADLQTKQSSKFLTKTLSTMISGASLAGSMLPGGGQYRDMAVMAGNNALQNLVNGRTQPTLNSLSPTEQIQMAGLIDDLKMKLIQTYQNYKNSLQTLAESHQTTVKNNNLYSKALASKNDLAIMAAGTAYYQALINETGLRQKGKLQRLALERLAGPDAVSQLELSARLDTTGSQTAKTGEPAKALPLRTETASVGTLALPLPDVSDLPQPMEIGPHLTSEIGPPAPVNSSPPPPAATRKAATREKKSAIPLPLPEILRHD